MLGLQGGETSFGAMGEDVQLLQSDLRHLDLDSPAQQTREGP